MVSLTMLSNHQQRETQQHIFPMVVDMSCYLQQQQQQQREAASEEQQQDDYMNENQDDCGVKQQPPLDQITVTTCSVTDHDDGEPHDDQDSLCSSLSLATDEAGQQEQQQEPEESNTQNSPLVTPPAAPRSIFGHYWNQQGYETSPFYRSSSPFYRSSPRAAYQNIPRRPFPPVPVTNDTNDALSPPLTSSRRSIFGQASPSQQQQQQPQQDQVLLRELWQQQTPSLPPCKSRSAAGFLEARPSKSCLLSSKNSNKKKISRSVSFCQHVRVQVVPSSSSVLTEQWAHQGWSKWFE